MFKKKEKQEKEIVLDVDTKSTYLLSYDLTYDEAYEAFSLLAFKWSKRFQVIIGIGLVLAAIISFVMVCVDPHNMPALLIAIFAIIMLFYLIYVPALRVRRGTKAVVNSGGHFVYTLTELGTILIPDAETVELKGDKDARAIETETIIVIRPNLQATFCIPKRVLTPKEYAGIKDILSEYITYDDRTEKQE